MRSSAEDQFLSALLELQYGLPVETKLKELSKKVSWAKGWPEKNESFWNAEAFMWQRKIDKKIREVIEKELDFLRPGKNLDLGCGSYSYIRSIGIDVSKKMLDFNDNLSERIVSDLEKPLPFTERSFDSVTAIFLLNYIHHYKRLLSEAHRVLKSGGYLVAVLSAKGINDWEKQKEINSFNSEEWKQTMSDFFETESYVKENLIFLRGRKK